MSNLTLPPDINIIQEIGSGRRSHAYLAEYLDNTIVVKVYNDAYIEKYQHQYKVNIGEFEYQRNKLAFETEALTQFVAKPYFLLTKEDGYSLALVQEYVEGIWLEDLIIQSQGIPKEVVEAGYLIVREAAKIGMYDLDISPGNVRVQQNDSGKWMPKLYDFNLMPQHMYSPNLFMAIGFKLGLRSKNHRDYRSLKHWQYLGALAEGKSNGK